MPYFVYIMTNFTNSVLYTGVTNDLKRRVREHKQVNRPGFTQRYNIKKLVYFESFHNPINAIAREKQIKGGSRKKKIDLVEARNPQWEDLLDQL